MKIMGSQGIALSLAALGAQQAFRGAGAAAIGDSVQGRGDVDCFEPRLVARAPQDWSKIDFSGVDWSKVDYSGNTPAAPAAPPTPIAPSAPSSVAPPPPVRAAMVTAAGDNTFTVTNHGSDAFTVGIFRNFSPEHPSFDPEQTFELQAGDTQTVAVALGWAGRVQKLSGSITDPATWGEVTFNGWSNLAYVDVSYIRGNNGAMTIATLDGNLGGTPEDLLGEAPDALKTVDSGGNTVLRATEGWDGATDWAVVDYYHQHASGGGFVQNFDAQMVHASHDSHLRVDIW